MEQKEERFQVNAPADPHLRSGSSMRVHGKYPDDELLDWDALLSPERNGKQDRLWEMTEMTADAIRRSVFRDKVAVLADADQLMRSICVRALWESEAYFRQYREYLGTEFATRLRPKIRWRPGRPVELSWVSKIVTKKPATSADMRRYTRKGTASNGVLIRIAVENNQILKVKEIFKFIPRGKSLSYPASTFRNEPGWVQLEGRRLEEAFAVLRQEMALLKEIRLKLNSIHTLDMKLMSTEAHRHFIGNELLLDSMERPKDFLARAGEFNEAKDDPEREEQQKSSSKEEKDESSESGVEINSNLSTPQYRFGSNESDDSFNSSFPSDFSDTSLQEDWRNELRW